MATTTKGYHYPLGTDRVMDGDNVIASLAADVDGWLGLAACGWVDVALPTPGTAGTVAVTFPAGRFTSPPQVMCTCNGSAVNIVQPPMAGSVTATGCNVTAARDSGTANAQIHWTAVQV